MNRLEIGFKIRRATRALAWLIFAVSLGTIAGVGIALLLAAPWYGG